MPPAQTPKAEAGVWKLVFLVAGLSVPSVVMPGTTGREQSSEAWGIDPVDGVGGDLGADEGCRRAVGQKCGLCRGQGPRGWAKEARVSLAAGVRLERWLNWVRPSAQPGLGPDLLALGPAELSPSWPVPHFYPQEQTFPACWLLRGLEGGQNPHSPLAGLCDLGQLAPPPLVLWALNTGIAGADFWAPPAFSSFDLILAA